MGEHEGASWENMRVPHGRFNSTSSTCIATQHIAVSSQSLGCAQHPCVVTAAIITIVILTVVADRK
jgi:hypothetical protein